MLVQFGDFTLDIDSRQLRCGGDERHLSPKGFELLRLLIESRPKAVSKSELHDRLWPSTFVSEATLSSLVAEVREALGEKAGDGRFVRTVHRFGYAFRGSATDADPAPSVEGPVRCWVLWESGQIALRDGEHLVGRDGDVTVWLESPTVSRHHARIRVAGPILTIEDLGSRNGTYLAGERITVAAPLVNGDEIRLGSFVLTFRIAGTGRSTETQQAAEAPSASRSPLQ